MGFYGKMYFLYLKIILKVSYRMSLFSKNDEYKQFQSYIEEGLVSVEALEHKQILEAGSQIPLVVFGNVIIGMITLVALWGNTPHDALMLWAIFLLFSLVGRGVLLLRYKAVTLESLARWKIYFIGSAFFSGVVWAVGAVLIENHLSIEHGLIAFILGGLTAGAVATNSFIKWNYLAFMLPILSSLTLFYLYINDTSHVLMACMLFAFMMILHSSSSTFRKLQIQKSVMMQVSENSLAKLQNSQQLLTEITSSMAEGVFVISNKGKLTFVNTPAQRMLGWTFQELKEEVQNKVCVHDNLKKIVHEVLSTKKAIYSRDTEFRRKNGKTFHASSTSAPMHSKEGGVVVVFRDITDQKELEKKLEYLAHHDALTTLYNRGKFDTILEEVLLAREQYLTPIALLIIDIDFFKKVNDTYGHQVGDEVITWIACILQKSIRSSDYVARYGGEEFSAILPNTTQEEAYVVAQKIRKKIEEMVFNTSSTHEKISLTTSIGLYGSSALISADTLIKYADDALYKAKQSGRNRVEVYTPTDA